MKKNSENGFWLITPLFLLVEAVLYWLILTTGGKTLVCSSFASIVLCFAHGLIYLRRDSLLLVMGLAFTVAADYCLVVCSPIEQLWGMIFFLIAQSLYAVKLQLSGKNRKLLYTRIALIVVAEAITVLVLGENTDPLAVVSLCYYANLIMNIVESFAQFRKYPLLGIGFVLFLLCDTVIGLQVAAGGYLPIGQDSWLYQLIFMPFNLSWLFYLPSQVLISLSSARKTNEMCTEEPMIHSMNLHPQPYAMIASGEKTIELRLNDEKRKQIAVGHRIRFTNRETDEQLTAEVIALHPFATFAQLYDSLPLEKCGYRKEELQTADAADMYAYYSPQQEEKYGVLGIELRVMESE